MDWEQIERSVIFCPNATTGEVDRQNLEVLS